MGKTSTEVKRRYNEKTYSRIAIDLRKEDYSRFETARGEMSRAQFLLKLLELYENHYSPES